MVYEKLCEILEDIFELDEGFLTKETSFSETLNADMEDLIELSLIIEEEFDILVSEAELEDVETVGDLEKLIVQKSEA
jgi:acyl carrier protein